jgi:hypothetical protein
LITAAAELWGTQSYSPLELEFNWTLTKVMEAASTAFTEAELTQGPKAITLPHQLSIVKVLNKSSNDDWLASHGGTEEEKAFYSYWRARGGQKLFDRFTGPAG